VFLITILRRSIAGGSMRSTDCHLCMCLPVCHRKISNSCGEITANFFQAAVAAGRGGGRGRTAARCCTLHGALVFDGRKFGILAFALQFFSASLYVFLNYSVHLGCVLPVGGGGTPWTFAPGRQNPCAATVRRTAFSSIYSYSYSYSYICKQMSKTLK